MHKKKIEVGTINSKLKEAAVTCTNNHCVLRITPQHHSERQMKGDCCQTIKLVKTPYILRPWAFLEYGITSIGSLKNSHEGRLRSWSTWAPNNFFFSFIYFFLPAFSGRNFLTTSIQKPQSWKSFAQKKQGYVFFLCRNNVKQENTALCKSGRRYSDRLWRQC